MPARPASTTVCMSASISATSVPGRIGSQVASTSSGRSGRSGLTSTNTAPRSRAARMAPRSTCRLTPPAAIAEFFSAIPPNATTVSVCAATWSQVTA